MISDCQESALFVFSILPEFVQQRFPGDAKAPGSFALVAVGRGQCG
jgi:hypothetical protein